MNIPPENLSITVYSVGPKGMRAALSPTGVKIEHLPTQTIAVCQAHRSQHKNRNTAMDMIEYALAELGYATK
jgi:peptide chain release factor 2